VVLLADGGVDVVVDVDVVVGALVGALEGAGWGVCWRLGLSLSLSFSLSLSLSFFWLLCSLPILSLLGSRTRLRSWAARSWLATWAVLATELTLPRDGGRPGTALASAKLADGGAGRAAWIVCWMLSRLPVRYVCGGC
jgi:hypothetical protein